MSDNENGRYDTAEDDQDASGIRRSSDRTTDEPTVEDDTPLHPDEQTVAETEAAYNAIRTSPPGGRPRSKPKSILLLLVVVAAVVGLGVYTIVWLDHLREKNEKIELRTLEQRYVISTWQQKNVELKQRQIDPTNPGIKLKPAYVEVKPLSPSEKATYDRLIKQYGSQYEPNDIEKAMIAETKELIARFAPASQPATKPQ